MIWCLNRPQQSKNRASLKKKIVAETVRVLEEEWSSGEGEILPVDIADDITKCYSKGLKL